MFSTPTAADWQIEMVGGTERDRNKHREEDEETLVHEVCLIFKAPEITTEG